MNPAFTESSTEQVDHLQEPVQDRNSIIMDRVTSPTLAATPCKKLDDPSEIDYFEKFIAKYLEPLEKNKKTEEQIATELKALRNRVSAGFLMANGLLVVGLLLLQINELDVPWPCGDDLTIEPIGFMFLIFYVLIMLIQTIGMLVHRTGTFLHIIAITLLPCSKKKDGDEFLTKEELEEVAKKGALQQDNAGNAKPQMNKDKYKTLSAAWIGRNLEGTFSGPKYTPWVRSPLPFAIPSIPESTEPTAGDDESVFELEESRAHSSNSTAENQNTSF